MNPGRAHPLPKAMHALPSEILRPLRLSIAAAARRPWIVLLILALTLGFAFQGTRALWSTDEGRYVDGAIQMLTSGDYLVPAYSPDRVNLSKPPVTYWVIAGAIAAFGYNTWAVRAPYAAAFVLTVLLLYAMGKRLLPSRPWLPALIYACSVLPFLSANVVNTDVLLTLFEAIAALGFIRFAFGKPQWSPKRNACLMWLGLALAFLTKGPPGLIMLLAIVPFVLVRDGWRQLGRLFLPQGLLLFAAVGLAWYGAVIVRDPHALHYFLYREVYERIFTAALQRNPGPFGWAKVYLPALALGALPWWPVAMRHLPARSMRRLVPWLRQHPAQLFVLLWFAIPLVVFCVARSRLPLYVLPLFVPLSLLLAGIGHFAIDLHHSVRLTMLAAWILMLLAFKGGVSMLAHPVSDHARSARELASLTQAVGYDALVFAENVDTNYQVEERTPWGLRLYLRKPVYGLAWYAQGHATRLCHAAHANASTVLLLAIPIARDAERTLTSNCPVGSFVRLGTWRNREVIWVKA